VPRRRALRTTGGLGESVARSTGARACGPGVADGWSGWIGEPDRNARAGISTGWAGPTDPVSPLR
jgi:hypothetical protein